MISSTFRCSGPELAEARSAKTQGGERLPDHLAGKPPLVVVPAHDLDQCPVHYPGHPCVNHRGPRVADDVGGDDRVVGDPEDAAVTVAGRLVPEGVVDLLAGDRPGSDSHHVRDGPDRNRHPERDPLEPPGQGGQRLSGDRKSVV